MTGISSGPLSSPPSPGAPAPAVVTSPLASSVTPHQPLFVERVELALPPNTITLNQLYAALGGSTGADVSTSLAAAAESKLNSRLVQALTDLGAAHGDPHVVTVLNFSPAALGAVKAAIDDLVHNAINYGLLALDAQPPDSSSNWREALTAARRGKPIPDDLREHLERRLTTLASLDGALPKPFIEVRLYADRLELDYSDGTLFPTFSKIKQNVEDPLWVAANLEIPTGNGWIIALGAFDGPATQDERGIVHLVKFPPPTAERA